VQKPTLYLFLGYPGAGKTTTARMIKQKTGAELLWADFERRKMFGDPEHSALENDALYAYLNNLTTELLHVGKSVIFDTNFNFFHDREHLRNIAKMAGADTKVIWITTPKEVAHKRAVHESEDKETRLYGNMSEEDFERIASHLEEPHESEHAITIDGCNLSENQLFDKLDIN
jgi:predicted kinase